MNRRVLRRMFTTPVTVFPTTAANSVGDIAELEPFELLGYVYDSLVVIENALGTKEMSTRQIYLPLDDIAKVDVSMRVSCKDSQKARIIRRQAYDGPNSNTLMGVIYLP